MNKTIVASFILGFLTTPLMAWSQSTSSLMIPLNDQTIQRIDGDFSQIDLLKEITNLKPSLRSSNVEIQMLRVEAKSGVGGAQIFLKINSSFVASAAIETNADNFESGDSKTFEKFELRNIERASLSQANLLIQNAQNLRLRSLEVIFGAVQEPVVFGRYMQDQASRIGGKEITDTRPTSSAVSQIYQTYYESSVPAPGERVDVVTAEPQVQVTQPQRPVQQQPSVARPVITAPPVIERPKVIANSRCVQNSNGRAYCIGDIVKNAWGFDQKIIAVNAARREVTVISDLYDDPYTRSVDKLTK